VRPEGVFTTTAPVADLTLEESFSCAGRPGVSQSIRTCELLWTHITLTIVRLVVTVFGLSVSPQVIRLDTGKGTLITLKRLPSSMNVIMGLEPI